jgi:hypothetical protein
MDQVKKDTPYPDEEQGVQGNDVCLWVVGGV